MLGNTGFFAFHPFSHMRDEFPLMGRGFGDLPDMCMKMLQPWSTGTLVNNFSPWSRPRARCCPHACVLVDSLQRSPSQQFVTLPSLFTDVTGTDHEAGEQKTEKGATSCDQCQGKDAASREQTASSHTNKDTTENSNSAKTPEKSPWQFSVDMKGCDEVRATTEKGMLMVEGRGSSDTSVHMVRYLTSLPRHVSHDSLTARLNNGRLTVTQNIAAQLEGEARTLPIEVDQQKSPEPEQQHQQEEQQQHNKEIPEQKEKAISSTDAQE